MALPWQLHQIPDGDAGVEATVRRMQSIYRDALRDPRIVQFAQRLVGLDQADGQAAQVQAVAAFVRARWRFVGDSLGFEQLKTPDRLLSESESYGKLQGDCDDATLLLMTLLGAIGIQSRIVVVQRDPRSPSFDHVYLEAWDGRRWVALDGVAKGRPLYYRPAGLREKIYPNWPS